MDILKGTRALVLVLWALFQSQVSNAQTFGAGYVKYQKGDFAGAESILTQALKTAQNPAERAKILKYRGIAQFMLGSSTAAKASFKEALSLAPSLTIDPSDVLDDEVLEVFNEVKNGSPGQESITSGSKPPSPTQPGKTDRPIKKTLLKVISTPTDAQVSIDGIFAGRTGEWIDTNPGTIPVMISAAGYEPKELMVTITANRENLVKVNLEKIKPKPPAKPVAKATPKLAAKPQEGAPSPQNPQAAMSRSRMRTGRTGSRAPSSTLDPRPAAQAPSGPDLATQFAMDAAAATQPVPAPYGGYAPSYAPGYAPGYGPQAYGPSYGSPGYYPNYGYGPSGQARYRYRQEDPDYLVLALPFGAGQFHQDRYVAGLFFLASEGYGLYYIVTGYRALQESKSRQDAYRNANCLSADLSAEKAAECNATTKAQEKFRSTTQTTITAASVGVFALILYGAADAIVKDPNFLLPPPPKRNRRSGDAPMSHEIKTAFTEHRSSPATWHWHLALSHTPAYDVGERASSSRILDQPAPEPTRIPGILWNLEWKF